MKSNHEFVMHNILIRRGFLSLAVNLETRQSKLEYVLLFYLKTLCIFGLVNACFNQIVYSIYNMLKPVIAINTLFLFIQIGKV